jgi:hypothetical protein
MDVASRYSSAMIYRHYISIKTYPSRSSALDSVPWIEVSASIGSRDAKIVPQGISKVHVQIEYIYTKGMYVIVQIKCPSFSFTETRDTRRIVMLVYQADTLFQQMSIRNYR